MKASPEESLKDYNDHFIRQLQDTITRIKADREMRDQYMLLEELLQDERKAGLAEGIALGRTEGLTEGLTSTRRGIIGLLNRFSDIPEPLRAYIEQETDTDILTNLILSAANAGSLDDFISANHLEDRFSIAK